jgi:hypothetical protein
MSAEPVKPAPSKDDQPARTQPPRPIASYARRDVRNVVAKVRNQ